MGTKASPQRREKNMDREQERSLEDTVAQKLRQLRKMCQNETESETNIDPTLQSNKMRPHGSTWNRTM